MKTLKRIENICFLPGGLSFLAFLVYDTNYSNYSGSKILRDFSLVSFCIFAVGTLALTIRIYLKISNWLD